LKKPLEILCIADHIDPLIYSDSLKKRFGHVDAVFSCGDLKRNYYEFIVSNLNVPFAYVLGNHSNFSLGKCLSDNFINDELFSGGWLADGKSVYLKKLDLIVAGFGGSIKYNTGENQYTETEMLFRILKMYPRLLWNRIVHGRYLDIFITHAPPKNVNDREDHCHQGFKIFRWFIRRFKPLCMIHGHIHLYSYDTVRETNYEGVPVINVYDHFLLKLPLEESKK
jgi:predicted phosphodiesterase